MILWQASFFGVSLRIESCLFMVFPPFPEHRRHACSFFVGLFFSVLPPRTTAYRRGGFPNLCLSVAPAAWNAFSCSGVMAAGAAPLRSLWLLRSCAACLWADRRPGRLGAQAPGGGLRPSSGRDPSSTDSARMAAAASGRATAFFAGAHRRLFPGGVLRSFPPSDVLRGLCFASLAERTPYERNVQ